MTAGGQAPRRALVDAAFLDEVRARLMSGAAGGGAGGEGVGSGSGAGTGTRPATDDEVRAAVDATVRRRGSLVGSSGLAGLVRTVRDEVYGAGPLQHLLDDPDVTDVLVNGPDDVWVEHAGRLRRTGVHLGSVDDVRALAVRLAAAGGQRLDEASPTVDARLPDGTRLHAVLPPVAGGCTLLSLRAVRVRALSVVELVAGGTLAPALVPVVRALVTSRANLLVSGATGSGKTTLLAALLSLVPPDERIVVIEESGELAPRHPHVVRLLARHANVEGAGRVELADLVRQSLRMRPDRVVLGECRGAEVREVLTALNTGHDGGCATVHANAAADVPARLEALAALAGLSRDAVAAQAASAFDAVLHLRRTAEGTRYLAEVAVVRRSTTGELEVVGALRADPAGVVTVEPAWAHLSARLGLPATDPVGADRGEPSPTTATLDARPTGAARGEPSITTPTVGRVVPARRPGGGGRGE